MVDATPKNNWTEISVKSSPKLVTVPKRVENYQVLFSYVYVIKQNKFVDMDDPTKMLTPKQFNEAYQHLTLPDDRMTPNSFIRKHNYETRVVTDMSMDTKNPNRIVDIDKDMKALNIYRPSPKPSVPITDYETPQLFLDHLYWLMEKDEKAVDHLLKWMAHVLFRPEHRMRNGICISGGQGIGKSIIFELCFQELIGKDNFMIIDSATLKLNFQDWMIGKRLILVEEVREHNNYSLYNKIKPYFSSDTLACNIKNQNIIKIDNNVNFVLLSNFVIPIPIEQSDRRIFFKRSRRVREEVSQDYFDKFADWFNSNGKWHLRKYLEREILPTVPDNFHFRAPYQTEDHKNLIKDSLHPIVDWVQFQLELPETERMSYFRTGAWFEWEDFKEAIPLDLKAFYKSPSNVKANLLECGLVRGQRRMVEGVVLQPFYFEQSEDILNEVFGKTDLANRKKIKSLKVDNQFASFTAFEETYPVPANFMKGDQHGLK